MFEVIDLGGYATRTPHHTKQSDPALAYFRTLADAKDFDSLEKFCAEMKLHARSADALLRWWKDSAIARALQGRHIEALNILSDAEWLAHNAGPRVLGRYRNEFGIMWGRLGRTSHALEQFGPAYQSAWAAGDRWACASIDHNRARVLMSRGERQKAMRYIRRALDYARNSNDYRLELEVLESIREFGGME